MRVATILFSVYLFLLAFVPCTDGVRMATSSDAETMTQTDAHDHTDFNHESDHSDHHDERDCEDLCTPFCLCSCCPSPVLLTAVSTFTPSSQVVAISTEVLPFSSVIVPSSFFNTIWQPPRVG